MRTATPSDLTITPRDLSFAASAPTSRWWLGGDPVATAFFDALSATFPYGERYFIECVRRYRGAAEPPLQQQIAAFVAQEAMHTREHVRLNGQIAAHGFDVAAMEARTKLRLDYARAQPPLKQLGGTIALEHFTAILAHALLADPRHLEGAPAEAQAMWRWHAIEELEHKAVAFDTFVVVAAKLPPWRRWLLRASTMGIATSLLFSTVGRNIADIFTAGGINRPGTWARLAAYLLVKPGILRQVSAEYLAYFRPGFHPWARDDRALAAEAERALPAMAELGVQM
ncbi:metal-dependent hydrolase [Phenylobacterium montanum]|uniref:Metal-dependent hydrolase n=1 Tax=Phenylobacterium montanum TaxID=2823693 RepID=A0A975G280_9CAUL|nr:metal-dependent hydrolase [Caulobacter sp. S6]QUD89788.1 metal-dependent hydrolase [Caulobacter sp. S6]